MICAKKRKSVTHIQGKKKTFSRTFIWCPQMLDLADKDVQATMRNEFKEQQEIVFKKIKEKYVNKSTNREFQKK